MEGIRERKRKKRIRKYIRAVTETVGAIGMAATWIGVSHMTNSSPALLPGATRIVAGLIVVTVAYIVNKVTRYAK
jgi:ammonia channel protein AmtB